MLVSTRGGTPEGALTGSESAPALCFRILGPLEGWVGERRLDLGGPIPRRILAVLLLEPGRLLTVDRLVDAAWPEEPPATASHQVRKAISELRRRIPDGTRVLITDGPGYAIARDTPLDAAEFTAKVREGEALARRGSNEEAADLLGAAIALRRGPVLSGIGDGVIESVARAMEEHHLSVVERYFDLRLASGRPAELIGELREYTGRHPLRERLCGLLMQALFRSGRRAEALTEYERLRRALAAELGVDPDPHVAKLYEEILVERTDSDPVEAPARSNAQAAPSALAESGPAVTAVPRTLPFDLVDFVGRGKELRQLLETARQDALRSRVIAIDGMGGTGKTSLAVHAAHQLADEYPGGQLYLNLRGFSRDERPVTLSAALEVLLRSFGVAQDRIPDHVVDKELLWRAVLARRRVLLLLDNVGNDTALVSRLLPTTPGCLVLVTSRARLVELDGAEWISIDVLEPEESMQFVARLLGPERVGAEPAASRELTQLCDHMPLALRIATARLSNRRTWALSYLVERLRDENRKLSELNSGRRGVAPTLRLSYQVLPEECRRTFRTLSLHPGPDFDAHSAGAVLAQGEQETEDQLEHLLDAHLLQQPEAGRYTYHDLVRSYARSLCEDVAAEERDATSKRLLDYYLAATEAACDILYPGRSHRPTGLDLPPVQLGALVRADGAKTWFAREHTALANVVHYAASVGQYRHAVGLSRNLAFYLNSLGALDEFEEFTRIAVQCARKLEDTQLLSVSLANLGVACWKLGRFAEGIEAATSGLDLAMEIGDRHTEAHAQGTLGLCKSLLGRFPEALGHLREAAALEQHLDSPRAQADTLTALSTLYEQWGRYREAAEAGQRAVSLLDGLGRHESALSIQTDLALARIGLRDLVGAEECLAQARGLCEDSNEPGLMALAMALSAEIGYCSGDPVWADRLTRQAQEQVEQSRSPLRQAKARNILGRLFHSRGRHEEAMRQHSQAYRAATSVSFRTEEAYALAGMATAAGALGDDDTAGAHRAAAETVFARLGVPLERRRRPPEPVSPTPRP